MLYCKFKVMNMLANSCKKSHKGETHLCSEIHKKVEQIVEDNHSLRVSRSNVDNYEVVDKNNNIVTLRLRKCPCQKWEVYGIPYKHACAAIMQTEISVHRYVDNYFTVESHCCAYAEPIYPILDHKKPNDDNRELHMWPPSTKKRPRYPRKKRIEAQAFDVRELCCSRCHDVGHKRLSCKAVIVN